MKTSYIFKIKKLRFFRENCFIVIASILLLSCNSQIPTTKHGEKLVWSDEFNYKGLPDSTKWNYEVGGDGYGNNEAQFYTENRLKNARVEHGNLIIEARIENWEKNKYTSARLLTRGNHSWKYGTFEIRAKLPRGRGTWPAIWMMSEDMKKWPDDGELDIMEHVGFHQGFIHATAHTKKYNHVIQTQKTDTLEVKDASEKFHVYKMTWTPDKIEMYVDETKYYTYLNTEKTYKAWPFDQPFFLLLNFAIGGDWGGIEGIDDSIFPQKFYVDYVRVYQ